ncbi:glycosyl hydrolase family 8 [Bacillus sp. FJAT-47783]|uniref:glycosyl hydrolase family 8 n=1 Tax=Bacillus sp. FJAT-47783 TaxID=2922712 RepID=UPI001FAE575F|nr:glycosyl hydrolase family 8 [Bacillus sp. FJAT-47783]
MKKIMLCLIILDLFMLGWFLIKNNNTPQTEKFIKKWMINPNGTIASNLIPDSPIDEDYVGGREALSESLGLWMIYAIEKNDSKLFFQAYNTLNLYFLTNDGFIYWKLTPEGQPKVSTNALVDDLRIIDALYQAGSKWRKEEYTETARVITESLIHRNLNQHLLTDFYNQKNGQIADTITISYIDVSTLKKMKKDNRLDETLYKHMVSLLENLPTKNGFYPKNFSIKKNSYEFEQITNMITQTLTAIRQIEAGKDSGKFFHFIKSEFQQNGVLYGRYNVITGKPANTYESPALYGLTILYCIKIDQLELANAFYERMIQLQENSIFNPFYGGYINTTDKNTHIFDNLLPLLATEKIKNAKRE